MSRGAPYTPGPAVGAEIDKDGERWTLVLVRQLRHPPERVWRALTEPAHLAAWAPFDADRSLATPGAVTLSTVGTPSPQVAEATVKRAEAPKLLEYDWGGRELRWELEQVGEETRLTLWHHIDRGFIAWGATGWHICFEVLERLLAGEPIGRIAGPTALALDGFKQLRADYARLLGVASPDSP